VRGASASLDVGQVHEHPTNPRLPRLDGRRQWPSQPNRMTVTIEGPLDRVTARVQTAQPATSGRNDVTGASSLALRGNRR
jgi:hypothetical protein